MSSILSVLKTVISWLAVVAGVLLGVFGLALLGVHPLPRPGYPWLPREWALTIGIAFLGVTPLAASLLAFRNRKRAGLLYFGSAAIVMLCALPSRGYDPAILTEARLLSTILVVLGLFWLVTHLRGWPRVAPELASSLRVRIGVVGLGSLLLFVMVSVTAIALSVSWERPGDCGSDGAPFLAEGRGGEPVFVARIVHIDRFLGAVAVVRERFGGLSRFHKIVFLKQGRAGEEYFVDGRIGEGLMTRYIFPVIDMKCTESATVQDAKVELRLLRGSRHWSGVRIMGKALILTTHFRALPGARIIIAGPVGTTVALTDQDGIYDVSDLPPGHYSVHADEGAYVSLYHEHPACRENREPAHLQPGDVWGCTLELMAKPNATRASP